MTLDIHDFFGSTLHSVAIDACNKRIRSPWAREEVEKIIHSFSTKDKPDKGIALGSQVA